FAGGFIEDPFGRGVQQRNFGGLTFTDDGHVQVEQSPWIDGNFFNKYRQVDQLGQGRDIGGKGLQVNHAEGRLIEFRLLAFFILGKVSAADHIDGTVFQSFDEGILVGLFPQRRHHLVVRVKVGHRAVVKQRLVRSYVARNVEFLFRRADQINGPCRRQPRQV